MMCGTMMHKYVRCRQFDVDRLALLSHTSDTKRETVCSAYPTRPVTLTRVGGDRCTEHTKGFVSQNHAKVSKSCERWRGRKREWGTDLCCGLQGSSRADAAGPRCRPVGRGSQTQQHTFFTHTCTCSTHKIAQTQKKRTHTQKTRTHTQKTRTQTQNTRTQLALPSPQISNIKYIYHAFVTIRMTVHAQTWIHSN